MLRALPETIIWSKHRRRHKRSNRRNFANEQFAVLETAYGAYARNAVLRPHVAVLTGISPAHLEHTGTLKKTAELKVRAFTGLEPGGIAIINKGFSLFDFAFDVARQHADRVVTYGDTTDSDVRLLDYCLERQIVRASVHGEESNRVSAQHGRKTHGAK